MTRRPSSYTCPHDCKCFSGGEAVGPLFCAVIDGHADCVKALVQEHDPNEGSPWGTSALMMAVCKLNFEVFKTLLPLADLDHRNIYDESVEDIIVAVHGHNSNIWSGALAAERERRELSALLPKAGLDSRSKSI